MGHQLVTSLFLQVALLEKQAGGWRDCSMVRRARVQLQYPHDGGG